MASKHVSKAIDRPGIIQNHRIADKKLRNCSPIPVLIEYINWYENWQDKTEECIVKCVMPRKNQNEKKNTFITKVGQIIERLN